MNKPENRDSLARALELLAREVRHRARSHPQAHILAGTDDSVEISLRLPVTERDGWLEKTHGIAAESIDESLRNVLLHRSAFKPGRVYCLRCASATCEHSSPEQPNQVFAGYGPSGLPRFEDLGQWLLECQEPQVDQLYRKPPRLVTHVAPGTDLASELLEVFEDGDSGYRLWGQVVAGWFHFPRPNGSEDLIALTFQVVSTQPPKGQRRFALNLVGSGPDGEPLENLYDLSGELPWARAAQWAQGVLEKLGRGRPAGAKAEAHLEKRIEGLLNGRRDVSSSDDAPGTGAPGTPKSATASASAPPGRPWTISPEPAPSNFSTTPGARPSWSWASAAGPMSSIPQASW